MLISCKLTVVVFSNAGQVNNLVDANLLQHFCRPNSRSTEYQVSLGMEKMRTLCDANRSRIPGVAKVPAVTTTIFAPISCKDLSALFMTWTPTAFVPL
jgi:hypothetical protein